MKWVRRIVFSILIFIGVAIGAIYSSGYGKLFNITAALIFHQPDLPFDPKSAVAPPDYAQPSSWVTLPERDDLADMTPLGVGDSLSSGTAPVDVFFMHPTGFLKGSSWTYSMALDTSTEENVQWTMANQASAYNGCCNIYAPRYRQASVYSYFSGREIRKQVLDFVYQDIEQAFQYYLEHYNHGRPFIIAGHSQGSHLGIRLLKQVIDDTPLAQQMVAAFLIGGGIDKSALEDMQSIHICANPSDINCLVHWDTYNQMVIDTSFPARVDNICVNPLSWQADGGLVGKEKHLGALQPSGEFHIEFTGSDAARGVVFEALSAAIPQHVEAQCKNGMLFISDQTGTSFEDISEGFGRGIYHNLDYPIFYMDIRENAKLRAKTYIDNSEIIQP